MATTLAQVQNLMVEWGVTQSPLIIADLIKRSGMLQTALIRKASDGVKHKYKWMNDLPAATFRSIGGSIVPTSISKDKVAIDLWNAITYLFAFVTTASIARPVFAKPFRNDVNPPDFSTF